MRRRPIPKHCGFWAPDAEEQTQTGLTSRLYDEVHPLTGVEQLKKGELVYVTLAQHLPTDQALELVYVEGAVFNILDIWKVSRIDVDTLSIRVSSLLYSSFKQQPVTLVQLQNLYPLIVVGKVNYRGLEKIVDGTKILTEKTILKIETGVCWDQLQNNSITYVPPVMDGTIISTLKDGWNLGSDAIQTPPLTDDIGEGVDL
jgi:hypothetical protein